MTRSDIDIIVGRIVVSYQLQSGMSPTEILVRYYDNLSRNVVASDLMLASTYREARDIVSFVKPKFFIDLAKASGTSLESIIELFKDSRVVKLFQKIGWSIKGFWEALRTGYQAFVSLQNAVAEYVSETKVMRWTRDELNKLDEWLSNHPKTKRISGWVLGALLLFLWYEAADIGDLDFDFDISDVLSAFSGGYTLSSIFAGTDGSKLLLALVAGAALRLSFPWPGPTSIRFIVSVIRTLANKVRARLKPATVPVEEEAQELGIA